LSDAAETCGYALVERYCLEDIAEAVALVLGVAVLVRDLVKTVVYELHIRF
jgi:hypothetical protein